MVKLKEIIGVIVNDITDVRAISDAYSRDLRSSYEKDPFLKYLSVPRTDIKEVTIDLKFAIIKNKNEVTSTSKVILYEHGNYQGASQELTIGNYDLNSLTLGGDKLSSLKVPKGIKVTLYEHPQFQGRGKSFTEDTSYVGDDFNDVTSSVKVEQIVTGNKTEDPTGIEVEVVTEELVKLPEAMISSISMALDLTNI